MADKRIVYQIDAFTTEKFKGNPAGVVYNADGLSTEQMQAIARELNNSETAFLLSPVADDCDGRIRYFTPLTEVPTCGHATISAMFVKALEERLDSCTLRMKIGIGTLPFQIIRTEDTYQVIMTQGKFELEEIDRDITGEILQALGVEGNELDERCPVQIASTGSSKVIVGLRTRKTLNALTPNHKRLEQISKVTGCNGYFAFTLDSNNPEILTYGRMFAPAIGINEDPVTGNANGPLGGYLVANKIVQYQNNQFQFRGRQGEKMGRPGCVLVNVRIENGMPSVVSITGDAVVMFKTEIEI